MRSKLLLMMIVLLIILYTLALIILIQRVTRHRLVNLSRTEIALAFSFKVVMGIVYGYVFLKFYGGDDTWNYFNGSLAEYNKLLFQSGQFFKEVIPFDSFDKYPGFTENFRDFLENLEYNAIAKTLAFFNLFSFQNYYVDVVFFNLFSFIGSYLLFKLFVIHWPQHRKLIYISAFFIPSISFWLSGIRADGMLLLAVAASLYYFNSWLITKNKLHLLWVFIGLAGILVFRYQVLLILLPALLSWWLSVRLSWKPSKAFTIVFVLGLILFFGSALISPGFNLPLLIVNKQREFFTLKGNTVFALRPLQPDLLSFLQTLPQAFLNTFLRPFPWEARGALQLAASLEILFFWAVLLLSLRRIRSIAGEPLTWFVFFFGLCSFLLIGYTVPFPGAIVRYKIIPEMLFFMLLLPQSGLKLKKMNI